MSNPLLNKIQETCKIIDEQEYELKLRKNKMSNQQRLEDVIETAIKEACTKFGYDYELALIKVGIARFTDEDLVFTDKEGKKAYQTRVLNIYTPSYEADRIKELEKLEEALITVFQYESSLIRGATQAPQLFEDSLPTPVATFNKENPCIDTHYFYKHLEKEEQNDNTTTN